MIEGLYIVPSTGVVAHRLQSPVDQPYLDINVVDEVSLRAIVVLENEGRALLEGAICPGDNDSLDFQVLARTSGLYYRARQRPRLIRVCLDLRRLFTLGEYLRLLRVCGRADIILVLRILRRGRGSENISEHERSNGNAHEKSALHTHPLCLLWSTVFYTREQGLRYLNKVTRRIAWWLCNPDLCPCHRHARHFPTNKSATFAALPTANHKGWPHRLSHRP